MKTLSKSTAYLRSRWAGLPAYDDVAELCDVVDALTSVPEDVARDRKEVETVLVDEAGYNAGWPCVDALSRLATAAARVTGLEAELAGMTANFDRAATAAAASANAHGEDRKTWARALEQAVSERDAAREKVALARSEGSLWVASAQKETERLTARVAELEALAERRRQERAEALTVTTTEGLSASEWMMRTGKAESRATAAEADRDEWKALASRGAEVAASARDAALEEAARESRCDCGAEGCVKGRWSAERILALRSQPAPTPAPVLREAVGPKMEEVRRNLWSMAYGESRHIVASITKAEGEKLLAAYDAPVEPTVTHADLAAVVEECAEEPWLAEGAREVLRRVTGGQVPETLPTARVVAVLATSRAIHLRRASEEPLGSSLKAEHGAMADACTQVATRLGLTLPMGPSEGNRSMLSNGSADPNPPNFSDGSDRAAESLARGEQQNGAQRRAWAADAVQRARIPNPTPEGPAMAQPDLAAPVVWEVNDWLRVRTDGVPETLRDERWHEYTPPVGRLLARALAEAKREADWARQNTRDMDRDRCNTINDLTRRMVEERADAARKAAEAMRERAARFIDVEANASGTANVVLLLRQLADAIRALPLEAK